MGSELKYNFEQFDENLEPVIREYSVLADFIGICGSVASCS